MIEITETILPNNLECIFFKDNSNPIINITLGYKVGSRHEDIDKKGVAHLFEHLMFQGSQNVKKSGHFEKIQQAGGSCNAFTNQDITVYHETVPSNHLQTVLWLESDRMLSLDLNEDNLKNQKDVVIEEKKSRYDNSPYGTSHINIFREMFRDSPYEITTIGREEDVLSFQREEAEAFHSKFYSPSNAILVISGDFKDGEADIYARKYFGDITKSNASVEISNKNYTLSLPDEKRITVEDNIQLPAIFICYSIPPSGSREEYTLDYLSGIIANNKSSRLHKKLVYDKKLVNSLSAVKYQMQEAGVYIFAAFSNIGADLDEIEKDIIEEINSIANSGIKDIEYEKIRNEIDYYYNVKHMTLSNVSLDLLFSKIYYGDAGFINFKIKNYLSVTPAEIQHSCREFFSSKPKLVLTYLPKK